MSKFKPKTLAEEIGKKKPFDSLEQETLLNLARTFSIMSGRLTKLLKQFEITPSQYNVLRILRGHGEPVSVYQIADEMISSLPDMPRLIDRMQAAGLVDKQRCESDRRVVWVALTTKSKKLLTKIDQPLIELHQKQFEHMSESQLRKLNELLEIARQTLV